MKLKKETLEELRVILKEEYKIEVNQSDLEKIAYSYYDILVCC